MRNHLLLLPLLAVQLMQPVTPARAQSAPSPLIFNVDQFEFNGTWIIESEAKVGQILRSHLATKKSEDALMAVTLSETGSYTIWAYSRDTSKGALKTRRFQVTVDGKPVDNHAPPHLRVWTWEKMGQQPLSQGEHLLGLRSVTAFARVRSVLLTTEPDFDPNKVSASALLSCHAKPVLIPPPQATQFQPSPENPNEKNRDVAQIETGGLRWIFSTSGNGPDGRITMRVETRATPSVPLHAFDGSMRLFVLHAPSAPVIFTYYPNWTASSVPFEINIGGVKTRVSQTADPFRAGQMTILDPVSARQVSPQEVEVSYLGAGDLHATATVTAGSGDYDLNFQASLITPEAGAYSVGMTTFRSFARNQVTSVQLPPWYEYLDYPTSPVMMVNGALTTPMALISAAPGVIDEKAWTVAVTAAAKRLPFVWPSGKDSAYGFSLVNPALNLQAGVFSPVLGLVGSIHSAGDRLESGWNLVLHPGGWEQTFEYVATSVLGVKDYRQPISVSLTEAALNIKELIQNDYSGGWDPDLKGPYDIEQPRADAKQSAPLALLSAALLWRDEDFYRNRALPTLEFVLTRRDCQLPRIKKNGHQIATRGEFHIPTVFYGSDLWAGYEQLLGGLDPWLDEFMLPGGRLAPTGYYNNAPEWSEKLAIYRARPTPDLLADIQQDAMKFIANDIDGAEHQATIGVENSGFANSGYYPYWWDLTELYEITGDKTYLAAAEHAAFHTLSQVSTQPPAPGGNITANAGGSLRTYAKENWKSDERGYRMGLPRRPGDTPEVEVPAWTVSPMGLGIEGVSSFFGPDYNLHVFASNWAPHLLRLYQYTGREIFRTFARNAVIGRFANYPGYYPGGFTPYPNDPKYPYQGPDITTIYFHHIPPHLAYTLDYLFAQAQVRSAGRIHFPFAVQQGFVWFTNRIYGGQAGEIFGEKGAVPWIERGLVDPGTRMVDWIAAQSPDRFHVILMSQANQAMTVTLKIDTSKAGIEPGLLMPGTGRQYRVYTGEEGVPSEQNGPEVRIPAKGLVALSFPAKPVSSPTRKPLREGHKTVDLGRHWGKADLFRIRGPFGSDALYAFINSPEAEGVTATLEVIDANGKKLTATSTRYPVECTVLPLPCGTLKSVITVQDKTNLNTARGEAVFNDPPLPGSGAEPDAATLSEPR
jgi:hypothetical protein